MDRIDLLYRAGESAIRIYIKTTYKLQLQGQLPKGPYVLLPKHQQMLDIPLEGMIAYETTRQLGNFVMRRLPFNFFLELLGGITIARPKDLKKRKITRQEGQYINEIAAQKAINRLRKKELVVIHPEGTRKWQEMNPIHIHPNSILEQIIDAQKYIGQIPFVPVGIKYTGSTITVKIGQPYYTNNREELAKHLRQELPKLSNLKYNTGKQTALNKHQHQTG